MVGGIQVDGTGTGQTTWLVPPGTPVGPATVIAVGIDFLEQPSERTRAIAICDTAPPSTPTTADGGDGTGQQGTLPRTGSDSGRLVGLAAALIVIGAAAVYGATRGRRQGSEV